MLGKASDNVATLLLTYACADATRSGLPCVGMFAVAFHLSGVLYFSLFHQHWLSHNIVRTPYCVAAFEGSQAFALDGNSILVDNSAHGAPSALQTGMPVPHGVQVSKARGNVTVTSADGYLDLDQQELLPIATELHQGTSIVNLTSLSSSVHDKVMPAPSKRARGMLRAANLTISQSAPGGRPMNEAKPAVVGIPSDGLMQIRPPAPASRVKKSRRYRASKKIKK